MLFFQAAAQPARLRASILAVHTGQVQLCLSKELVAEIQDVLSRPEYRAKFPALRPEAVEAFIADVLAHASVLDPVPIAFTWPQHPDDDHLFNLAIAAKAVYLVTWESRILKLGVDTTAAALLLRHLAPQLAIVTPPQLAAELKRRGEPPGVAPSPANPER
jgi:putative PIN family toxin of toxin-antitoxin system